MKEKCVTFCFIKLNANRFLQNYRGKGDSSVQKLVSSFKVNTYSHFFLLKPQPWSSGKVKREIITTNWTDESRIAKPLKTYDLRKWANFNAVYLSFHWLNDSRTREFELVTRGFKFITRGLELISRVFELVARGLELITPGFKLVTREFEFGSCKVELVTREFELAVLNFKSCFKLSTRN